MEYRVEQKYMVTEDTIAYLKKRLETCMKYDSHAGKEGYLIRSIYFDDMYDTCFWENENGVDPREKFRIRAYNGKDDFVSLELKAKRRGYTKKESQEITSDICRQLMCGRFPSLTEIAETDINSGRKEKEDSGNFLMKKLYSKYLLSRMQPVCIIEYERVAFVDRIGNVRITFDQNIGVCEETEHFFDKRIMSVPMLPGGTHVLEVKYDELLPDAYKSILKECNLQRTDYSKYYYGRLALKREERTIE